MAPIPKTMRGVRVDKTGGPEVLDYRSDLPVPTLKTGDVLVRNEYVGINFIDTYFRTGLYESPKPEILGREGAGVIVAIADAPASSSTSTSASTTTSSSAAPSSTSPSSANVVTNILGTALEIGMRVVYSIPSGVYAEYTAVPASKVQPIPEGVSTQTAAAAYLQGITALALIDDAGQVQKGDWVLVTAASGGVGQLLCQILKRRGAHTIAVASTEAKRDVARQNGAQVAVPYDQALETVRELTGGMGVPVVLDSVGKDTFDMALDALARKGHLVSYGNASGPVPPFSINRLMPKNLTLRRPTAFTYLVEPSEWKHYMPLFWEALGPDGINVPVHKIYDLSDVRQAHTDIESRRTSGKLLMKV